MIDPRPHATPLHSLSPQTLRQRLREGSLILRTGPLRMAIQSRRENVAQALALIYANHPIEAPGSFADYHVELRDTDALRRWIKPQIIFEHDGYAPFLALPRPQAFALLEWGMNWCVANYSHQFLMAHAAVIERNGLAAILPAPPGSGKSTLCAALVHRGWRLLSDEMTLIDPATAKALPLTRPINLKNASIDILRAFAPEAVFGPIVPDTKKGTVAHVRAPLDAVQRMDEPATPRWIIFPRYEAGAATQMTTMPRHHAFLQLAENAFNYAALGRQGFDLMGDVVEACECLQFRYSKLDEAVSTFNALADAAAGVAP